MALLPPGVFEEFPADHERLTPLFRQYTEVKAQYPEALLLYRLGDFYEMFGLDAIRGAAILGLTLTSRACYKDYKVAMCGIPHHAGTRYIKRLIEAGETVAVCEQTEDASQAKGLVERAVTRVITAGTLIEDEYLSEDTSNFLTVLTGGKDRYGVAVLESSGGRVELHELTTPDARSAHEYILRRRPAEVLVSRELRSDAQFMDAAPQGTGPVYHAYSQVPGGNDVEYFLTRYFSVASLDSFGIGGSPLAQAALYALIRYLKETFKAGQVNLYPEFVPPDGHLYIDRRTVEHLELTQGIYGALNRCGTSAGRRMLREWLVAPLADAGGISARHEAVGMLAGDEAYSEELGTLQQSIQDIERIVHRAGLNRTNPKEVKALGDSLVPLTELGRRLLESGVQCLEELGSSIPDFTGLAQGILGTLTDDPPVKLSDLCVIRDGVDADVDELRGLVGGGKEWFEAYQEQERERSGIRTLKVKQTGAFGYFIEVSKANLALVPDDYDRKQTLVNAERFTTPELTDRETKVKTAESKLIAREQELFKALCDEIVKHSFELAAAARAAAAADVLGSLAVVAREKGWTRAALNTCQRLDIRNGRHPLVEESVGTRYYTPNDCYLDARNSQVSLVTGPNMGGKSTYLRMVATIAIINQIGGFVPAESADLPVFSRVYTRVGAHDALSKGQSTFMVEMVETAEILNTCGNGSLVLLDEVGRGTSTYDGISLAKAVVEYLHEHAGRPLTLFATHFFELTDLALVLDRVKNLKVEVAREEDRFVFLYRVSPGAASESYGIDVAALAGLPREVVERARAVLREFEDVKNVARERARQAVQLGLFGK